MIKFALRPNLIYILQLIIWTALRKVERIIMSEVLGFNNSSIFTSLMFLGEFLAGLIIYTYQEKFLSKKQKPTKFMSIILRQASDELVPRDRTRKIYVLIFFTAFFDFIEFTLSASCLNKFVNISGSLESRLSGILTISAALFFYYVLKLPIFKHQYFSLLIIGFCLILVIITEFFFQKINIFITYKLFIPALLVIFAIHLFNSFLDSIEKYLFEYDYFNPFKTLMWEGIFGVIITLIYHFYDNPLNDIKKFYENKGLDDLIILIILFILYVILCGGRNAFRIITNKIYSPMAKTLTDYFLNPIYITIDFARGKDFLSEESLRIPYFIINLVISFIITICGCVYNEFIVLFCFKFEYDTHDQIAMRASLFLKDISSFPDDNSIEGNDNNINDINYMLNYD